MPNETAVFLISCVHNFLMEIVVESVFHFASYMSKFCLLGKAYTIPILFLCKQGKFSLSSVKLV